MEAPFCRDDAALWIIWINVSGKYRRDRLVIIDRTEGSQEIERWTEPSDCFTEGGGTLGCAVNHAKAISCRSTIDSTGIIEAIAKRAILCGKFPRRSGEGSG
jgi:hypothetical protein